MKMTKTRRKHQALDFSLEFPFQAAQSLLCLFICLIVCCSCNSQLSRPQPLPPKTRQDYGVWLKLPFNLATAAGRRCHVRICTAAQRHASLRGFKLLQSRSSPLSFLSRVKKSANLHILRACGMSACFPALTFGIRLHAENDFLGSWLRMYALHWQPLKTVCLCCYFEFMLGLLHLWEQGEQNSNFLHMMSNVFSLWGSICLPYPLPVRVVGVFCNQSQLLLGKKQGCTPDKLFSKHNLSTAEKGKNSARDLVAPLPLTDWSHRCCLKLPASS